ncbi:hypothetical protein [Variovorax ginsengisoli]|uniref:Integral membrane protein n=1 Tax=Variovorax ginsengisoli TaxID=363844 RepID=A0ABT9S9M6_9BURK|nr:hypothetical protein [Variovorax ginsengisoli]MDP9900436.1 hypothetical protein [Variovorax ginsengisoli]
MPNVFRWWLVPSLASALAALLLVNAVRTPQHEGPLLVLGILASLPWSLALMALDLAPGFAERAGIVVGAGLLINTGLLWALCALWRARRRKRAG